MQEMLLTEYQVTACDVANTPRHYSVLNIFKCLTLFAESFLTPSRLFVVKVRCNISFPNIIIIYYYYLLIYLFRGNRVF